jgi:hypothetical protein
MSEPIHPVYKWLGFLMMIATFVGVLVLVALVN